MLVGPFDPGRLGARGTRCHWSFDSGESDVLRCMGTWGFISASRAVLVTSSHLLSHRTPSSRPFLLCGKGESIR